MAVGVKGVGPRVLLTLFATVVLTAGVSAAGGAFTAETTTTTTTTTSITTTTTEPPDVTIATLLRCFGSVGGKQKTGEGKPATWGVLLVDGLVTRLTVFRTGSARSGCANPRQICTAARPAPADHDDDHGTLSLVQDGDGVIAMVGLVSLPLSTDQVIACPSLSTAPRVTTSTTTTTTTSSTTTANVPTTSTVRTTSTVPTTTSAPPSSDTSEPSVPPTAPASTAS